MNQNWFRRRWFDFRQGHGVYLIFMLTFANFILIFHRLLIERVEVLDKLFSELWVFILVFVAIYIPAAIIIGAWHRKTQLRVEADVIILQNPLLAKILRTIMDAHTGKISESEIEEMRKLLKSIEDKNG